MSFPKSQLVCGGGWTSIQAVWPQNHMPLHHAFMPPYFSRIMAMLLLLFQSSQQTLDKTRALQMAYITYAIKTTKGCHVTSLCSINMREIHKLTSNLENVI